MEFFSNPAASPSGYGQGQTFVGFLSVPINSSGTASISITLANVVAVGQFITATATDPAGNTSEFSADLLVQSATTTVVASAANPSVFGQPVTFTATVSRTMTGQSTPTGSVAFFDGPTELGTATLSSGIARFTTAALIVGSHSITAQYLGDAMDNRSTAAAVIQTVNQDGTVTAVTSTADPSVLGQPVTFTATVSAAAPGAGTPTGAITFYDGSTSLGGGTLSGGVATYTTSALSVGPHSITVSYGGDENFLTSASAVLSQVINQANSSTSIAVDVNPSVFGQQATLTAAVAAVTPGVGKPTGTVELFDGTTELGVESLGSSGSRAFSLANLAVGAHLFTVQYLGDGNFIGSASPVVSQIVYQASTTTSLVAQPASSVFGQSVTFTATVGAVSPGAGSPTGSVMFLDGSTTLGSTTLDGSATAAFTTSALTVGTDLITAVYSGDDNFNGSTSANTEQTVSPASTMTAITSSGNPSVYGQQVTFTIAIGVVSPGTGVPTGTVTFYDGAESLGSGTLSGGAAVFATSALAPGAHSVTASYSGDGNFTSSTSAALSQAVNQDGTATVVTSTASPSVFGQSVTFTAAVSAMAPGSGTPTGTVTFLDGSSTLGTSTLDGAATASVSTSTLTAGSNLITVVYGGDVNFNTSTSSAVSQSVNQASTTTSVAFSVNPSMFGQSVTFTATVTPNAAEPQPKRINKNGVLPPKWCCLDTHLGAERHEDAFAFRHQVYQPDRRCALLF